ncbi:MAG: RCC1 domain-containing protein [Myxococcota bacterium]
MRRSMCSLLCSPLRTMMTVLMVGALGCSDPAPATQTVLRFRSSPSLAVPGDAELRLVVYRNGERQSEPGVVLEPRPFEEDIKLVVNAADDAPGRRFTVFAELLDGAGERLSWARIRTGFVAGELSEVRVDFAPGCPAPPDREVQAADYEPLGACGSHDTCLSNGDGARCDVACAEPEPFREAGGGAASPVGTCPDADCAAVDEVALGWQSTCAMSNGAVFCWGRIGFQDPGEGQLDRPAWILDESDRATPGPYEQVVTEVRHTCALLPSGEVRCGGDNGVAGGSVLGNAGITDDRACCTVVPMEVPPTFSRIAAGPGLTCGLSGGDGTVWCSGRAEGGGGMGTDVFVRRGSALGASALYMGREFICTQEATTLRCTDEEDPLDGSQIDVAGARSISSGLRTLCVVSADGTLTCYGDDPQQQRYGAPRELGEGWVRVAVPSHDLSGDGGPRAGHRCGIRDDGTLRCWGESSAGAAGVLTSFVPEDQPQPVGDATDWVAVDVGQGHSCGIREGGRLFCWGEAANGRLGGAPGGPTPSSVCVPSW